MANTLYVGTAQGDYASITAALQAAADGDVIVVKGSEYTLTDEKISLNKSVTLKAEGTVVVDSIGLGAGTGQNVVIDGFTIKPSNCDASGRTRGIYQEVAKLTTLEVRNCTIDTSEPAAGTKIAYGIHLDLNFSGTEKVIVDGCTFKGDAYYTTSAMRASYQSSIEFTNNTVSDISGHAVQLSLTGPTYGYNGEAAVTFEGNTFTDIGCCGIYAADIANSNVIFDVTGNEFTNINVDGGSAYWGAIRFGSGTASGLTVKDNTVTNGNVGVYNGLTLKEGAAGTFDISENTFVLADREGYSDNKIYSASAVNVYDAGIGNSVPADAAGNEIIIAEPNTNIIVAAAIEGKAGDMVVIDGKAYVIGTNAFTTISAAVAAAKKIDGKAVIEVTAGDYAENVTLSGKTFTEDGKTYAGGLTIKAAAGADVNITGQIWINSGVTDIKDLTFDGLNIECVAKANGYYTPLGINSNGSVTASGITITNCTLTSVATGDKVGTEGIQFGWGVNVDGAIISGNTITADCGIYTEGANNANMTITGNTVIGRGEKSTNSSYAGWAGIYITRVQDGVVISDNIVRDTAYVSVRTTGNGAVLSGNAFSGCTDERLVLLSNGTVLDNNTVDGKPLADLFEAYTGTDILVCGGIAGEEGATVLIDGKACTVGRNVYGSFVDALKNVTAENTAIKLYGNIVESAGTGSIKVVMTNDLVISGGKVTWEGGNGNVVFSKAEGVESATLTFEDFVLDGNNTKVFYFGNGVTANIESGSSISIYNGAIQPGAVVAVKEGGAFNALKEALQVQASGDLKGTLLIEGREDFTAANATLADRQAFIKYVNVDGVVDVTDTFYASYDYIRVRNSGEFTADNALVQIGADINNTWQGNPVPNGFGRLEVSGDAKFNLTNGSILKASGNITNSALINIENSTFIADGAVASDGVIADAYNKGIVSNSGTIEIDGAVFTAKTLDNTGSVNVSGESTVKATVSGNAVSFAEGTTLVDSNINYTGDGYTVIDGVTFKGDNVINSGKYTTGGCTFTVEAGATLKATGGRFTFGSGSVFTATGELASATALTAEELANTEKTLDIAGISISGSKESTMTITDAYVSLGNVSTSKYCSGGTFNFNFTNSYVVTTVRFVVSNSKDTLAALNITLDGSVFAPATGFTQESVNGTLTLTNGSKMVTSVMRNFGTITIDSTSTLELTSYFRSSHGDQYGVINVNGGDFIISGGNQEFALMGQNGAELNITDGGTFDAAKLGNGLLIEEGASITIDATSTLIASKIVSNGTITIDAAGFTNGVQKVIDLSGKESLEGKVTLINSDGAVLVYAADGDVVLANVATDTMYVNPQWSELAAGTEVEAGKVIGVNAFAGISEAMNKATADTREIKVYGDVSDVLSGEKISVKISKGGENDVVITDSANDNYVNFTGAEIGEGVTVDAKYFYLYGENNFAGTVKSSTTFYSSGKLTLTGKAEVYTTMSRYYSDAEDGIYVVGTAAAGEGKNAEVQYKSNNYLGHYSGTFSVKDTAAEFGYILLNGSNDKDGYSQAKLVVDNALVKTIGGPNTQPGQVLMDDDAAIIAINGSVLDFRGPKDFAYISMGASNSISLTDSTMLLGKDGQGSSTLNGTVTLVNSSIVGLGTLNGSANITLDATSSIVATSLTAGSITIDVKGYTGDTVKVIDLSQSAALTGVTLKNASNNYYLTYGADGDVIVNKAPEAVYVSSDYNSETEGWGVTRFANYDSAVTFVKNNAKKATIVIEKTNTLSGNCFQDKTESLGVDLTNTVIVKDGAVVGNTQSKWDMTYAVTIEAGGILQSVRPASAGYGNTHIKNTLTVGEAGSEKKAEIRFVNGLSGIGYKTMSIALLSGLSRALVANNALIQVGDLGLQSKASFTDTTLTIEGILAIKGTSMYKTTMTGTTVTIKGHNLMNENTYYSTIGTILSTLTMDNSSIVVDDGSDETVAEKVWLGHNGNTARTLTLTNGSSITVEKGTEVEVGNQVVATDSEITVGTLNAGTTKQESFYFNGLEKGTVYYAVIYDSEGNEIETITRTSLNASTFYPSFTLQKAGKYTAICYKDAEKTQVVAEKTVTFSAVGTMELNNSDLYADKLILSNGNISLDINSTIGFNSFEGGYVVVSNAAGYVDNKGVNDGTYKLFDYTGDNALTVDDYKALLNDQWHDNYIVLNNDLYLTDQSTAEIYVNNTWAGAEFGDIVGDGQIFGFNGYVDFNFAASEETAKLNIASGTYSSTEGVFNNSVTLLKGGIVSVNAGDVVVDKGSIVFATEAAGTVSINGNFTATDKIRYTGTWGVDWTELQNGHIRFVGGDDTVFEINGSFTSGENIQFIGGKAIISATSVLSNNPANWGQYLVNGAEVINYGSMSLNLNAVNGSAMNILGGGSLTISGENASLYINMKDGGATNKDINITNGSLIVEDGAKVTTTGAVTVAANGVLEVAGADVKFATVNNSGAIKLDINSTFAADTLTGEGSIIIDAANYTGTKKVIDLADTASLNGKVVIENLAEGMKVLYNNEGDVVLTNAVTTTVYYNDAWAGLAFGTEVEPGKVVGYNAFAKFDTSGTNDKGWSNLLVLPEDADTIVLTAGNKVTYGMLRPTQSVTVYSEGEGYAVIDRFVNVLGDLTFAAGSKFQVNATGGLSGANNQGDYKVIVNGEVYLANSDPSDNKALYLWGMSSNNTDGQLLINAGGLLRADAANLENHGTITVYGKMELGAAGDAPKMAGVGTGSGGWHGKLIVDGKDGEGIVEVKHNQINFGGGNTSVAWLDAPGESSVIIRNGGKITTAAVSFRNGKNCTLTIENGTLEFTDDANYAGLNPRYFDNQGTIKISGGVISMANREFTNNGAITIDAASKLIVPELILGENSSITIDAANFTETSKVIELSGTESLRGKVTLVDAENKYNLFYDDADGDVFITDESAENISVNSAWAASKVGDVVGDGFIFGYNAFAGFNKGIGAAVYEAMQNGTVSTINSINETDYVVGESRYTYKGKVGQDVLRVGVEFSGKEFTITGETSGDDSIAIEMRGANKEDLSVVDGKVATVKIKDATLAAYKLSAYTNSAIEITDSVIDMRVYNSNGTWFQNGPLQTEGTGTLTITNSTILNNTQLSAYGKLLKLDNSTLYSGSGCGINSGTMEVVNNSKYILSSAAIFSSEDPAVKGKLVIDNSEMVRKAVLTEADDSNQMVSDWTANGDLPRFRVHVGDYKGSHGKGAGEMIVRNGATFDFSSAFAASEYADVENANTQVGLVTVSDGSSLVIDGRDAEGNANKVTFNVDSVVNNGSMIISGEASVKAAVTGNLSFGEAGVAFSDDTVITVSGDITAAGDVSFSYGDVAADGSFTFTNNGKLTISDAVLPAAGNTVTVYAGNISGYGSMVINNSNVLDNTIVVDGVMYNVDTTSGIVVKLDEEPIYADPVTITVNSITQSADEQYKFVFDLTCGGGNGDYTIVDITAADAWGNAFEGTFSVVDNSFTFANAATTSPVIFTVYAQDGYGINTRVSQTAASDVVDYTDPVISSFAGTADGDKVTLSWTATDNFAVVGCTVRINGKEETVLGANQNTYTYTAATTGTYTYAITAFDAAGNVVNSTVESVYLYVNMSYDEVTVSQTSDSYEFTVEANVVNGDGNYTYAISKVLDSTGKELAFTSVGNKFVLTGTPDADASNISVEMVVTDGANKVLNVNANVDVVDYDAPEIASITGNAADWTNKAVVLTANTSDNFGVASIQYKIGSGEWQNGAVATVESNATVTFKVTDAAGNETTESVVVDKIDTTAATLKVTGNATEWTKEAVTLTASAADNVEVASIQYKVGNGEWQTGSSVTVVANATVIFKATDLAGNETVESVVVDKIDTTAATLDIAGNATEWTNKPVTLTASAADNVKVASIQYKVGNGEWQTGSSVTVAANATVTFKATDLAGNVTTESVVVDKIDTALPTVSAEVSTTERTAFVTITATAGDIGSGVANIKYSLNGSDWMNYTGAVKVTRNGEVYFQSIDAIGQMSAIETVTVDNIVSVQSDLLANGYSQIVAWDASRGAVGYIAYEGNASAEWKGIWQWNSDEAAMWQVCAVGKFGSSTADHDGLLLYNASNNTFAAWTDITTPNYGYESLCWVGSDFATKCIANLDGDGFDDVLIFNEQGSFGAVLNAKEYKDIWHVEGTSSYELVGAGFFGTADGRDSLVVRNTTANTVELWHNNGDIKTTWAWSGTVLSTADSDWEIAAIGDFQGDGIDDIVMWQKSTGYMFAWENGKADNQRWVGALDNAGWEVAAVGDYNGDGKEDLLLRELTSGWGGLGYWGSASANNWNDLNARIENDNNGSKFGVIA